MMAFALSLLSASLLFAAQPAEKLCLEKTYYTGMGEKMMHKTVYVIRKGRREDIQDRILKVGEPEIREHWFINKDGRKIYLRSGDGSIFYDDDRRVFPRGSSEAAAAREEADEQYREALANPECGDRNQLPEPVKPVPVEPAVLK